MTRFGPKWLETAIFYEIYPPSFYDSNDDGIGDLQGIVEKLDHLVYLGCNALWINPCFVSPFQDGGYDISDYYNIAPRYGTNDDMRRLCKAAAERGIRVCLDLVPGHTSIEHPWFKESCKPEHNKYTNRFVWNDDPFKRLDGDMYFVSGYGDRDGSFMPNFFYFQPALNYGFANPDPERSWQLPVDHPDVLALREEMKKIMRFWLDMGVSGFRVDMAASLVKNDPDSKATSEIWHEIRAMLEKDYPEAILISEWLDPIRAIPAGFHIDFFLFWAKVHDCLFRCNIPRVYTFYHLDEKDRHAFFSKSGKGTVHYFIEDYMAHYESTRDQGYISLVSGNHDQERISFTRDMDDLEVVYAFLLTMPGIPFIYYGDEIGMRFMEELPSKEGGYYRTGVRSCMQWSDGKNAGFSNGSEADLYLPLDKRPGAPTVAAQKGDPNSLLEKVRALIALRKEHPALLSKGNFTPVYAEKWKYPFVYSRSIENETILVALNPSAEPVDVTLEGEKEYSLLSGKGASLVTDGGKVRLSMQGVSYGIFIER